MNGQKSVKLKHESAYEGRSAVKYLVPVVQSTFRILGDLSSAGSLSLNQITLRTSVPKSTVFRILSTLQHLGYIRRDETGRTYSVSHSLANLSNDVASAEELRRAALPHMLRLRDKFGETVNLGKLNLDKVVYVEVVPSEYALRLSEQPGASVWAHASAMGKAILAYSHEEAVDSVLRNRRLLALTPNTIIDPDEFRRELHRVKERGYAFDKEETTPLAICVAVPIFDALGSALAAISMSGPTSRFNPRRDKSVVAALLEAASATSKQYRHRPDQAPEPSRPAKKSVRSPHKAG